MNKKMYLLCILILVGLLNINPVFCLSEERVLFSHTSGFYQNEFFLQLSHSHPDAIIRYTTDGSIPDENSYLYTGDIQIFDSSNQPLTISLIPTANEWVSPGDIRKKAIVIVARAFWSDSIISPVSYATYFINDNRAFEHKLPVLSIIVDPDDFFDDNRGIYVRGNNVNIFNFNRRGRGWERPIHLEFFETDGTVVYSDGAGVRIHGGTSRNFPQKCLRLYFRSEYGENRLRHEVFPGYKVNSFKRLLLRPSGHDDYFTMIRDGFMTTLVENTNQDLMAYRPAVLYINGEYWGIHNLRERLDKYYINSHYGLDPDSIDLLAYTHHSAALGDDEHYRYMLSFLEDNDLKCDTNYQYLATLMDIDSYMDYKISEIFYYRWDIGNIRHWRERSPDGRWRWMLFDLDTGYGGFWSIDEPWNFNMLEYNTEANGAWNHMLGHSHNRPLATFLLRKLLENPAFRIQFITRFADLLNTNFLPSVALSLIDEYSGAIADEIPAHSSRWRRIESVEAWHGHLNHMRDFARLRPDIQRGQLLRFFEMDSTINLILDVDQNQAGYVRVNTIPINSTTPGVSESVYPWYGVYFKDKPVVLKAYPSYGYEFSHWEGASNSTDPVITLQADHDIFIKAHFVRTKQPIVLHYWMFDSSLANDTPLEQIEPGFSLVPGAQLVFESCLEGYPFHKGHSMWRKASMERRNNPTPLNYKPESNDNIPYESSQIRGLQIKQPFIWQQKHNTLIFDVPTQGFSDIVLRLAVMDERAISQLILEYSIDGSQTWTNQGLSHAKMELFPDMYLLLEVDFGNIKEANNNPDFKVRIRFEGPLASFDHGNRVTLNNISIEGIPLEYFTISSLLTSNGKIEPSGPIQLYKGESAEFRIVADEGFVIADLKMDNVSIFDRLIWTNQNEALIRLENVTSNHELSAVFSEIASPDPKLHFTISPNPARNVLLITAPSAIYRIELINISGQIVLQQNVSDQEKMEINIEALKNGMHVVRIYTQHEINIQKMIIVR